jgi:hypothetical protein
MVTERHVESPHPTKDGEAEQPIPLAWRPTLREIVRVFAKLDYRLESGVAGVEPVSAELAEQIRSYLADYGATLVELPDDTWETSVAQWYDPHWDFLLDLWSAEEGRTDLVLSGRVSETANTYRFTLHLVYVP